MLPIISIICLLSIGIILLLLEIIVIPGLPIVGIVGLLFETGSIWACYYYYGQSAATWYALSVIIFTIFLVVIAFKSNFWNKFALNKSLIAFKEKEKFTQVNIGDVGITNSTLRPSGKATFKELSLEVVSISGLIPPKTEVSVVLIKPGKIFVKTII